MLYLFFLSSDAITNLSKPSSYTFTGQVNVTASYGHSVSVSLSEQQYTVSGFSMEIIQNTTSDESYVWVQSAAYQLSYTNSKTSTVTFSIGDDNYIGYSVVEGSSSKSGTRTAGCTVKFTCAVL